MNDHNLLERAKSLLAPWGKSVTTPEPNRLDVELAANDLVAAVTALHASRWGYLSAITGIDLIPGPASKKAAEARGVADFEVLYHFCSGAAIVTLRVRTPRTEATVPSICPVIPSASALERELSEMFGINVMGAPDPSRLYLPDEWPEGLYPLRKDFVVASQPHG